MSDKYLTLLRKLPTTEHILNHDRRVQVFKGEDAYKLLLEHIKGNQVTRDTPSQSDKHADNAATPNRPVSQSNIRQPDPLRELHQTVYQIMNGLIASEHIVRCTVDKNSVTLNLSKQFNRTDSFIWVEDNTPILQTVLSACLLLCILALVLFQVWPNKIKSKVSLVIYPVLAFFIFIAILGVIRLIVFCITYFTHKPGIWLFPNLFADVGFIDSFIPVWSWHGEDVRHKKKED